MREAASNSQCKNNLKQMGLAMQAYHDSNLCFPSGYLSTQATADPNFTTAPGWGWGTLILPYIEQGNLYNQLQFAVQFKVSMRDPSVANARTSVSIYLCPSDLPPPAGYFTVPDLPANASYPLIYSQASAGTIQAGASSYAVCVGRDEDSDADGVSGSGVFYCNSRTRITDIKDGSSNTILLGDRAWCFANGVWAGALPGGAMAFGPNNPNVAVISGGMPNSPIYAPPVLVQVHAHLINPSTDGDGGLDDFSSQHVGGVNLLFADGSVHFAATTPPDPDPGSTGAIQSPYPPPFGTSGAWYTAASINFMGFGTRAGGEVTKPLD